MWDRNLDWYDLDKAHPAKAGQYVWEVPHVSKEGVKVVFTARFHAKMLGSTDLFPAFSNWNGYSVVIPKGVRWREVTKSDPTVTKTNSYALIRITDGDKKIDLDPCPFCNNVPEWKGINGHAVAFPHEYRNYTAKCCNYINTYGIVHNHPTDFAKSWNKTLRRGS